MTILHVKINQNCLLKCSYCSAQHSSGWAEELERYGEYPTITELPIVPKPNTDDFLDKWVNNYTKLTHVIIDSGEPITSDTTLKILDYITSFPNPELTLEIWSSFAVPTASFNDYLERVAALVHKKCVKKFVQVVSIDSGMSDHTEYIRYGMSAPMFYHNVMRYLNVTTDIAQLKFNIVVNNLSVPGLQPLLEWVLDLRADYGQEASRIQFDLQPIEHPSYQSPQIAPVWLAEHAARVAHWAVTSSGNPYIPDPGFTADELDKIQSLVDFMYAGRELDIKYVRSQQADFFRFFHEYDRRKKISFAKTFPEFRDWWQECQWCAENGY